MIWQQMTFFILTHQKLNYVDNIFRPLKSSYFQNAYFGVTTFRVETMLQKLFQVHT